MGSSGERHLHAHAHLGLGRPTWRRWSMLWLMRGLSCGTRLCRYWELRWRGAGCGLERGRSGGCETGRSLCRTLGRTSTPSGMWSARFGTRPRAGDSPFCPTSCVSRSPSRNTCDWVSASAPVLMAKLGPRVQMGPARVGVGVWLLY